MISIDVCNRVRWASKSEARARKAITMAGEFISNGFITDSGVIRYDEIQTIEIDSLKDGLIYNHHVVVSNGKRRMSKWYKTLGECKKIHKMLTVIVYGEEGHEESGDGTEAGSVTIEGSGSSLEGCVE